MKLFFKSLYHKYYRFQSFKVLGRTACLGNEIIKQMGWGKNYINHQKSRVDYLLDLNKNNYIFSNADEVVKYLKHKFIKGTIEHQRYNFFRYPKPDIIVMDSFSELTDQLFFNQSSNTRFLANYGDVDHSLLPIDFQCLGLLEENKLFQTYDEFFEKIEQIYFNTPLYFVHFSTALDTREKFKHRGGMIQKIINELSKKYKFIHSIEVDDKFVNKANSDNEEYNNLPYHYSNETYDIYIQKFRESLVNANS